MANLPPGVRHAPLNRNPQAAFMAATTQDGASVFQNELRMQQGGNRQEQNMRGAVPQMATQMREAGVSAMSAGATQEHAMRARMTHDAAEAAQANTYDPRTEALRLAQAYKARAGTPTDYLTQLGQLASA